jgi:acyl-CoA thioester hydrolase
VTQDWPHNETFRVAFHDIDALNHLNHAAYFVYMESLRCGYYVPITGNSDPTQMDIIIAEATCRYFAPARYDDELIGEVTPARPLGRTSFVLLYRFRSPDGSVVYAKGRTVVVSYDYEKRTKKAIPENLKVRLERETIDPATEGWT